MSAGSLKSGLTAVYIVPYVIAASIGVLFLSWSDMAQILDRGLLSLVSSIPAVIASLASGTTFLVSLIIQHLLPAPAKEVIVFWRINDRLPGCRAFSHFAERDSRIDIDQIRALGGDSSLNPKEQNRLWYKMYKSVANMPSVTQSHRRFLGFRDLSGVVLLTSPVLLGAHALMAFDWARFSIIGALLVVSYLATVLAARNAAGEFVRNVLALQTRAP